MPAIITHHLFGEDASRLFPEGVLCSEEELLAFLLGNQGPDPLFAAFSCLPQTALLCHRLGSAMHTSHVVDTLWALRESVSHLPVADQRVGRAFVLGFLGHYVLDMTTHPLIYAEQNQLVDAGVGLEDAAGEVHSLLESDIDVWMLSEKRGLTVAEVPTTCFLGRTDRVTRVAGALVAQAAAQVFGIGLGPGDFAGAIDDYELFYKLIDPAETKTETGLARLEGMVRAHSRLHAMAHHVEFDEKCPSANLARHGWIDPMTHQVRHDSFPDLYHEALDKGPALAEYYARGQRDEFAAACKGINFYGMPEE